MRPCAIEGLRNILVDRFANGRLDGLQEALVELGGRRTVCCVFLRSE